MFSTPPKGESLFVEPLEARIAPTGLTGLANNPADSGNGSYVAYATTPTSGKLGFVPASAYGVTGTNVYALKLSGDGGTDANGHSTGDQLIIYNSATGYSTPFIQAVNGSVIAFFQDKNGDGQVQSNELTGLSLGKGVSINVNGNVNGDIVTNLAKDGNSLTLNSAGNAKESIASINVLGNITGNILAGGDVNNITVTGNVAGILAGSAVNGVAYHFGDPSAVTATLAAAPLKHGRTGASIANVTLLSLSNSIQAGNGGVGAPGGSVNAITFQGDTDGFHIFSGNGGRGNAAVRGGPGGEISGILVKGVTDTSPNSLIDIEAGRGGNNPTLNGGKGGMVDSVAVSFDSFDPVAGTQQVSADLLADNIVVAGGAGGSGLHGGPGGSVSNSVLFGSIPDDGAVNADGSPNAEIQVLGGVGGVGTIAGRGRGGVGGGISQVSAENLNFSAAATASSILIHAGDGVGGRNGGNVESVTILGRELTVVAGNGGDGASGGVGGSLNSISILSNTLLSANYLTLDAGVGGAASAGNGGAGGSITTVNMLDANLASLVINGGTHANGGAGNGGVGGAGGSLSGIQLGDSGGTSLGTFTVRGGTGGDGSFGGGVGGDIGTTQIIGSDFSYQVAAGAGGNILAGGQGRGGDGGQLNTVGISDQPFAIVANGTQTLYYTGANGVASAGAGGNGNRGGAGGDVAQVDLSTSVDTTLTAGVGGSAIRKTGAGGSIASSVGDSLYGSVTAAAGNAGATGVKAAAGGSITGFIAAAANNISITAGNGAFGGAGGDIANSGTNLDDVTQLINTGNVTVTAGNGSSANGVAGAGGSISVFSGYIGTSGQTAISAGAGGGGGGGATAAGAGGSVDQVKLTGAGVPPVTTTTGTGTTPPPVIENPVLVTIDAGDAGSAGKLNRGATGGSVTNVTIYNLAPETTVQHIAAGDGGNALKHGGLGGSISQVNVGTAGDTVADIGFRSGVAYGYAAGTGAGGLFAGAGGTGAKSGGAAGDVTNITANAISSIVAGKGSTPQLAGTVDGIFLEGLVATAADSTGAFTNFDTANLVGSVINPTAAGASVYQSGDGLIAAAVLTTNRNFVPEALLTLDTSGNVELVDYQQPNPSPVVTAG
jgi:hypothetical protein